MAQKGNYCKSLCLLTLPSQVLKGNGMDICHVTTSCPRYHVQLPVSQSVRWVFDVETHIALLTIVHNYCSELCNFIIVISQLPGNFFNVLTMGPQARLQNFNPINTKLTEIRWNLHTYRCSYNQPVKYYN